MHTRINRYMALKLPDTKNECAPTIKDPQNNALAGTGSPIKEVV